jgi:sugar/nucleoside kinase (ribokinase family)
MTVKKLKPVLCIGDLVADIFASPLERLPEPGEAVVTERIQIFPGGNALNAAVALCRMGDPVAVAGSIGDDALGSLLLKHLEDLGLETSGVLRESGNTASTLVVRAEGEDRRFISSLGVGESFTGEHISREFIPENGIVLIAGYLKLAAWKDDALIKLLLEARRKKNIIVLNVCHIKNSSVDPKRVLGLLNYVDIFAPNEDEAAVITGETELGKQARVLRRCGTDLVVITRGEQGLYAESDDLHVILGSIKVPVTDPSGCGDCFTAGLLAALRRDWNMMKILKFASALGAIGATALGCTTAVPRFDEAVEFLNINQLKISVQESGYE